MHRGALEHGAVDVEARAVAGAVPGALGAVPAQQAAEMGTAERDGVPRPGVVAEDAGAPGPVAHDGGLARRHVAARTGPGRAHAVPDEVPGELRAELGQLG